MAEATHVEVAGRRLRLTNLDKVLWPETQTTKAELIHYLIDAADVALPHLRGRALTLKRWPNGVDAPSFFEKNLPSHAPEWIPRVDAPGGVRSGTVEERATMAWIGQQGAIELHVPMVRAAEPDRPTGAVFDLDPGPPADVVTCCRVALMVRNVLDTVGLRCWAKTSGSKGLQLYVPLHGSGVTSADASNFALAVGQLLERQHGSLVLTEMTKAKRPGKVFIDWSQNHRAKTTIAVYSPRGRSRPTVSTPVTWDEVSDASSVDDLTFVMDDVRERLQTYGDLFAPVATLEQELPVRPG